MSYPKQLLRLQPVGGIVLDTADQEVGPKFWTGGRNVIFRDGFATRLPGYRSAYVDELSTVDPGTLIHAVNTDLGGTNWWLVVEADGSLHAIQTATASDLNSGWQAIPRPQDVSSALLNGVPILSNGVNEPKYWPGSGDALTLPGWTATESCRFIAVLKYHVFALNISGPGGTFENLVKWSSAAEPGTVPGSWTPAPDNEAGSVELSDSPGELLCAYPLGDSLMIYKRSATYQARYVGGNNVFAFRKVQSASGALTPRSVCDVGGAHFIVSDGDIILNDGTTRRSLGEAKMREYLFNQLEPDEFGQLFCSYNRARDEVIIGFPSLGSTYCDQALVYDMSTDSFGVRDIEQATHAAVGFISDAAPGNTWADRTEVWADAQGTWASSLISGARDSLVIVNATQMIQQDSATAVALNAEISKTGIHFGQPERVKFVKRVHVRTRSTFGTLYVRVGSQATPNGPTTWSQEVAITGDEQIVNLFAQGRYISVSIRSDDAQLWKVTAIELEAELRGYH